MGKSFSNNLNIDWIEEKRSDDQVVKLYANIKPFTTINQVIIELNTAPVDLESKKTREAEKKGFNPNNPRSPAFTTKEIILNFEKPISIERRNDIINASIWAFKDERKLTKGYTQLIFNAFTKNDASLEKQYL